MKSYISRKFPLATRKTGQNFELRRSMKPPRAGELALFFPRVSYQHLVRTEFTLVTRELPHLVVRPALLSNTHRPRPRKHRRIVDRRFVVHRVGVHERQSLHDMRLVAEKIADDAEPEFRVEIGDVHDQRVPLPVT